MAALVLGALTGCAPDHDAAGGVHSARPLAVHPVDKLRARPAPLDAPESYRWSDRARFRADLERHVADLHRQAIVLRNGLRSGMGAATAQSWPRVRIDVLDAVVRLGRPVERARLAATPPKPTITI